MRQPTMPTGLVRNGSLVLERWNAERAAMRAGSLLPTGGPAVAQPQAWAPARTRPVPQATGAMARFMAASNDRLVADMLESFGLRSGNAELRQSLRRLRMNSRRLATDNEYVKHFLHLLRNNVVGPRGIALQLKIRKQRKNELDDGANTTIEAGYKEYSRKGVFTACGRLSRAEFERAAITQIARDGEVIIEHLVGKFSRFGVASRLIDPDLLDDELNIGPGQAWPGVGSLPAGNTVRMGVEVNAYMRPVAYWFHASHPGDDLGMVRPARHRRVPAERITHWFLAEEGRADAVRGVPWIYAGLRRMAMTGGYEEAALVSARQGAAKMGFYVQPESEAGGPINGTELAHNQQEAEDDPAADLRQEVEPGVLDVLPKGWDFKAYDPAYPHDGMAPFIKAMLRAFAASVGISYSTLASDQENVNMSSMRHAALNDRDTYEAIQERLIENVSQPIFERWLRMALDLGQVGSLPADGYERFNKPRFIPRPWRSPDPQKDVAAAAQAVALGVTSRTRVCAEQGADFEEVLDELANEEALARQHGVTLNTAAAQATKNPPATAPAGGQGDGAAANGGDSQPTEGAQGAGNDG